MCIHATEFAATAPQTHFAPKGCVAPQNNSNTARFITDFPNVFCSFATVSNRAPAMPGSTSKQMDATTDQV